MDKLFSLTRQFYSEERGTTSLEFVLVFPIFFAFFLMTFESGIISARHVMLERGVDITVREIRIGQIAVPTRERLQERICEVALIIPNCDTDMQIEMIRRDPRNWQPVSPRVQCIDRSEEAQPVVEFTPGGNNDLMLIRVCTRIDPFMPTTGLGRAIANNNSDAAAGGSYALISSAAFVVEPFQ